MKDYSPKPLRWVKLKVPETKGRPLEEIEHQLGSVEA
jgi:hypothetical protein